jgi:hypothetical protein
MKGILFVHRDAPNFVPESRFPIVKSPFFETQSNGLKATISES